MKNDRFDIMGTMGGDILLSDPCKEFSQSDKMAQGMDRGLHASLARSEKEWGLAEPVRSATNQIETEALAQWLTEPKVKVKQQIVQAFGPNFDQGASPDGPSLSTGLKGP